MEKKKLESWYDPESDILYVQVQEGELADSKEISKDVRIDVDRHETILGIEIHNARRRILEPISSEIASILQERIAST